MALLDQLKQSVSNPLIDKLKGGVLVTAGGIGNVAKGFSQNVLNPVNQYVVKPLISNVNQQFGDIMGINSPAGQSLPNPAQFGNNLAQGAGNVIKNTAQFTLGLPGQFGADVYQGTKGLATGQPGINVRTPIPSKLSETIGQQQSVKKLANVLGLPPQAGDLASITVPFAGDVARAYSFGGAVSTGANAGQQALTPALPGSTVDINDKFMGDTIRDYAMKLNRSVTGDAVNLNNPVAKEIASINPSSLNNPTDFYTTIKQILVDNNLATAKNLQLLKETTRNFFSTGVLSEAPIYETGGINKAPALKIMQESAKKINQINPYLK